MRQVCTRLLLGIVCLLAGTSLVPAESKNQQPKNQPGPKLLLVDRNRDHLSDSLEQKLLEARPDDLFRVVVTFDGPGNSAMARQQVGAFLLHRDFQIIPGFSATMRAAQITALARTPGVFRIEEDFQVTINMDSARHDFGVERAYVDYEVNGNGCVICVVDTGVSPTHPQLDSKVPVPFYDAINGLTSAYDDHGHGTHVASIAAGDGAGPSPAAQYHGVAPAARIYAAKVLDSSGSGTDSQVIAGIQWCVNQGVDIISMSLGSDAASDGLDSLSQTVNAAVASGKIVVVAAGNAGDATETVGAPGAAENAITVGAVAEWSAPVGAANHSDGVYLAPFSSRGPTLAVPEVIKPDIVAPGVSIMAANASTNGYIAYSGTSMATPFISGAVALGLQRRKESSMSSLSPLQVRGLLESSALDRGPQGKDNDWGAGLVDVAGFVAAMGATTTSPTPFPQIQRIVSSVPDNGLRTIQFEVGLAALSVPIAATITIEGTFSCYFPWFGGCLIGEWLPDLDAQLRDPNGNVIAYSGCAGQGDLCGLAGRQETLAVMPTVAGIYTIEVWPYSGQGGAFSVDLSTGPVGTLPPPPPPPPNTPPSVSIFSPTSGQNVSGIVPVKISASDAEDAAGSLQVELAVDGAWQSATYNGSTGYYESAWDTTKANNGAHTLQARAKDSGSATTSSSTVNVTVSNAQLHIGDLEGSSKLIKNSWTASVAIEVHDGSDILTQGAKVTGSWSWAGISKTGSCRTGSNGVCAISSPQLSKSIGRAMFMVSSVVKAGYVYNPSANHDKDGDSTGTTITIAWP